MGFRIPDDSWAKKSKYGVTWHGVPSKTTVDISNVENDNELTELTMKRGVYRYTPCSDKSDFILLVK